MPTLRLSSSNIDVPSEEEKNHTNFYDDVRVYVCLCINQTFMSTFFASLEVKKPPLSKNIFKQS